MGLPGQIYRYSVYAVKEVDGEAVRSIPVVIRNVSYPGVAPVKNLQVQTLVNGIQLDWTRTDEDIEGYYVYRDDEPIADLPGGTYTYQDYGGVPEATHVYAVAAYYTAADGEIYTSDLRRKEQLYPRLTAPDNLVLQDSVGGKLLKWIYPYVNGYDGFELFLARDTIEWVVVSADSLSFYDDGGLPGESYPYGVRVYKKVAGERFYSDLTLIAAASDLIASQSDNFGARVAISGDWAAVAQSDVQDYKGVSIYHRKNTGKWEVVDTLLGQIEPYGDFWKGALVMDGDYLLTSYNDYEVDSLGYLILYKRNGESWNQFTEIRGEGYYKYISRADFNAETGYLILRWTHEANREYSNDVIEESFDVFILNNTTGAFDFGTSLTFDGQYSNSSSNGGGSAYAVAVNNEFIGAAYTSGGYNYFSGLKLPMTDLRDILVGEGIGAVERGISMILRDDELFAGDPNYGSFYGAVMHYRYDTENNTWSYDSFIASDSLEIGAQFGWSLATDQDYLLVGAPQAAEKGAAFLFEEIEGSWILKKKFAPEEENIRGFGQDVDLDGSYIVIGASDVNANGKVFFFDLQGDTSGVFPTLPAPQNLNASDAETIYGYVSTRMGRMTSDLNDGFRSVYSDEVAIDTIRNAGARRYQDIISVEELGGEFQYYLKAFKVEEKEYFESEPSYAVVGSIKYYVLYGQFGYNGYSYSNNNVTIYKGRAAVQSASNIISVYEKTENGIWRKVLNTPGILGGFFYPPSFANFSEPRSMVNIKNVDHENENENGYLRFNLLIYDSFGSPNHLGIGIGTGDKFYKGSRLDISPGIDFIYKYYTYDEPYQLMQSSEKVKIWSDKGFF
jgi:hypothetical protein